MATIDTDGKFTISGFAHGHLLMSTVVEHILRAAVDKEQCLWTQLEAGAKQLVATASSTEARFLNSVPSAFLNQQRIQSWLPSYDVTKGSLICAFVRKPPYFKISPNGSSGNRKGVRFSLQIHR